jgi:myo-inositol-1(or 4)-monophosphatase
MSVIELPQSQSGKSALDIATSASKEAGKILLDSFDNEKKVVVKSKGNLVTDVDTRTEEYVIRTIKEEYPDHLIVSEELNYANTPKGYTWIIDPLDGTNNYVFGIPFFSVNVALLYDRRILLAVTYDPIRQELFHAVQGNGAYLNGSPIKVSEASTLHDSLLGLDLGYSNKRGRELIDIISSLWWRVHCIRIIGSAALGLAYVAAGRITTYIHRYVQPWDIASGLLLIREAGGVVTNWTGKEAKHSDKKIIASNRQVHGQLLEFLGIDKDNG